MKNSKTFVFFPERETHISPGLDALGLSQADTRRSERALQKLIMDRSFRANTPMLHNPGLDALGYYEKLFQS